MYAKLDSLGVILELSDEPQDGFEALGAGGDIAQVGDVQRNGMVFRAADIDLGEVVRAERERMLNASDWTQLRDVPDATADAWQEYRQALRDVPAQAGFPESVEWPIAPT